MQKDKDFWENLPCDEAMFHVNALMITHKGYWE
jgi:hypothetical protein